MQFQTRPNQEEVSLMQSGTLANVMWPYGFFLTFAGGPADQAGLQQLDTLLQLNGQPVEQWKCVDLAHAIRYGAPNTQKCQTLRAPLVCLAFWHKAVW